MRREATSQLRRCSCLRKGILRCTSSLIVLAWAGVANRVPTRKSVRMVIEMGRIGL